MPSNLHNADFHYFMGNMRDLPKLALQRAGNESSGTLKGTALPSPERLPAAQGFGRRGFAQAGVMVVQHTESPFTGIAIN